MIYVQGIGFYEGRRSMVVHVRRLLFQRTKKYHRKYAHLQRCHVGVAGQSVLLLPKEGAAQPEEDALVLAICQSGPQTLHRLQHPERDAQNAHPSNAARPPRTSYTWHTVNL